MLLPEWNHVTLDINCYNFHWSHTVVWHIKEQNMQPWKIILLNVTRKVINHSYIQEMKRPWRFMIPKPWTSSTISPSPLSVTLSSFLFYSSPLSIPPTPTLSSSLTPFTYLFFHQIELAKSEVTKILPSQSGVGKRQTWKMKGSSA